MRKNTCKVIAVILLAVVCLPVSVFTQETKTLQLPEPQIDGGMPLMQALNQRKSTRAFSSEELPAQTLSNLLWAAFGINREDGKRTAPSASNMQEIDIYAAKADGLYFYDAKANLLKQILAEDIRESAGRQAFVKDAPITLIFVADFDKMRGNDDNKKFYSATDTGYISQNVYLFCASEGLATVVLGMVDKSALAEIMGLRENQRVILTQPVGFPKK